LLDRSGRRRARDAAGVRLAAFGGRLSGRHEDRRLCPRRPQRGGRRRGSTDRLRAEGRRRPDRRAVRPGLCRSEPGAGRVGSGPDPGRGRSARHRQGSGRIRRSGASGGRRDASVRPAPDQERGRGARGAGSCALSRGPGADDAGDAIARRTGGAGRLALHACAGDRRRGGRGAGRPAWDQLRRSADAAAAAAVRGAGADGGAEPALRRRLCDPASTRSAGRGRQRRLSRTCEIARPAPEDAGPDVWRRRQARPVGARPAGRTPTLRRAAATAARTARPRRPGRNSSPAPLIEVGQRRVQHPRHGPAIGDAVGLFMDFRRGADQGDGVVQLAQRPDEVEEAARQAQQHQGQLGLHQARRDGLGADGGETAQGRLPPKQHAGHGGDQQQIGRGEEGARVDRMAQQLAVDQSHLAVGHGAHPSVSHRQHVHIKRAAAARWRPAGEVRDGQGLRRPVRRPLPAHRHVLSGQLRLHPAHPVGRRRPLRRDRAEPDAGGAGLRHPLAPDRRAEDGRRGRRRRKDPGRAGRQAEPLLHRGLQLSSAARHPDRADRALLRALQGSGERQVGQGRRLGRRGRSRRADRRRHGRSPGQAGRQARSRRLIGRVSENEEAPLETTGPFFWALWLAAR
uniref:Glutathione gamma-glutamate hydrolase n=1 Tax=Parastrongyloides trichosuri TaxID=131310 RepID=A0A0N4ZHZ9_PARTI